MLICHISGWRVGWAIAPAFLASAIRNIHIRVTDSAPAPFQEAALIALRSPPEYYESLKRVRPQQYIRGDIVLVFILRSLLIVFLIFLSINRIINQNETILSSCLLELVSRYSLYLKVPSSYLLRFLIIAPYLMYVRSLLSSNKC